jgi:hypothetical protein
LAVTPILTSTLTIVNDAQIQTFENGGATDLNRASVNFDALVNEAVPVVQPPPPTEVTQGIVLPEEEVFEEILTPDVRTEEFDDIQAAIGQQEELSRVYSIFLDIRNLPRKEWAADLDVESIKKIIKSSPNDVYRPGTYQIIREKEGEPPQVLETFEKLPDDPERAQDGETASDAADPALGMQRVLPQREADPQHDASVWIREWQKWMTSGQFPQEAPPPPPAEGGQDPGSLWQPLPRTTRQPARLNHSFRFQGRIIARRRQPRVWVAWWLGVPWRCCISIDAGTVRMGPFRARHTTPFSRASRIHAGKTLRRSRSINFRGADGVCWVKGG